MNHGDASAQEFFIGFLSRGGENSYRSVSAQPSARNRGWLRGATAAIGLSLSFPYEFSKTLQLAPSPFDFETWQDKVGSDSFQSRKKQHVAFAVRALTHDPVPRLPLRHRPSK